jgi:SagB-type dehydrogenase family enzyme
MTRTELNLDDAYAYACRLRGDPRFVNPQDWEVDWADSPWPVKIYLNGRRIPLVTAEPYWAVKPLDQGRADLETLGKLLHLSAGCTTVRLPLAEARTEWSGRPPGYIAPGLRIGRSIASGGAMYPTEVYVCARSIIGLPAGVYHFDPARHQLVQIGADDPTQALAEALHRPPGCLGQAVLLLTSFFWKNLYKYGDFSYRLGAVDAGVVLGRLFRLGELAFAAASVRLQFKDDLLNGLVSVQWRDESTYAAVILGSAGAARSAHRPELSPSAGKPIRRLDTRQRSRRVKHTGDFDAMHRSAMITGRTLDAARPGPARMPGPGGAPGAQTLPLPTVPALAAEQLQRAAALRASRGTHFSGDRVPLAAVASVLREGHGCAQALLRRCPERGLPEPVLYCVLIRVSGGEPGSYRYIPQAPALELICPGRFGPDLADAVHAGNVNVDLSGFVAYLVGGLDFRPYGLGTRAYRMQQILAGAACDAICVAASAAGLSGHPFLGFDATRADRLCGLDGSPFGALAQVCVGAVRPGLQLMGSVVA